MDGVGTFEMADTLSELSIFTCLVKTYSVDELVEFFNADRYIRTNNVAMSIGITDRDYEKLQMVYKQVSNFKYVCIDVANGYSERFSGFVRKFRNEYSKCCNYCR